MKIVLAIVLAFSTIALADWVKPGRIDNTGIQSSGIETDVDYYNPGEEIYIEGAPHFLQDGPAVSTEMRCPGGQKPVMTCRHVRTGGRLHGCRGHWCRNSFGGRDCVAKSKPCGK